MAVSGRVAVVNDSEEVLELLTELLTDHDPTYEVMQLSAETATAEEIATGRPDLVILDLRLGARSDGWEILKEMRERDDLATVPVIVCTADAQSVRERADELEAISDTHVLHKPFDLDAFETLVSRIMGEQLKRSAPA